MFNFKTTILLLTLTVTFTNSFYIIAPDRAKNDPFCYVNALAVQDHNVLHWKVYDPKPKEFELYISLTDQKGEIIAEGSSKLDDDTLPFQYKKHDMIRICVESNAPDGLRVHLGYRLAVLEGDNKKRANMKQADHLNQIVFDA